MVGIKEKTKSIAVKFAQDHYNFNYDLVFYDVTTLYFETFEADDLRTPVISKDNKSQQPQILIEYTVFKNTAFK